MSPPSSQPEFSCETCNLPFQRKEHYQRHLRTHTKEKPFTCSECGQSFGRVDSLARHHTTLHVPADRQDSRGRPNDRRRVSQACKPCSASKVRCDGEHPCQRCRQQDNECYYEPHAKRKMSETSSDRPNSKRNREKAPVNVEVMESISVNVNRTNSPLSPPATVQDKVSNNTNYAQHYISPAHDQFIPDDANTNVQAIDPQLDAQHISSFGPENHQHGPNDMLFDTDDILANFNSADIMPAPLPSMLFGDNFNTNGWLNYGSDQSFAPLFLQNDSSLDVINELWFDHAGFKAPQQQIVSQLTPASSLVDQSAVAELYSRSHSPAIDRDAVEPREYVAVSIELDAQLNFPDLSHLTAEDVDHENLAHVDDISEEVAKNVAEAAAEIQNGCNFPHFRNLSIPPTPVLNAWVQLYFEYFHPVMPILHKSTFSSSKRHWLLIFTVAAIGAHFSNIKDAQACSRAMHETIRRQCSTMCERQNSNGRELWMSQTILLNHIGLLYGGERRSLEIGEFLQALPVTLGRRKRLFTTMFPVDKFAQLQLPHAQKWQIWLLDEERRRAGFAIWLLDSAFSSHFDLTSLMRLSELQISLPQPDDRWGASTAQCWANFPAVENTGSGGLPTMERVVSEDSWRPVWSKTNTLGKQVMLQHLTNVIKDRSADQPGTPGFSYHDKLLASNVLTDLLNLIEADQIEQSVDEAKASTTHKIMGLTALMTHHTPVQSLLPMIIRCIYGKLEDKDWEAISDRWRGASGQGRLGCFYAARILHVVRSSRSSHFGTPVSLLHAVLVLWLYSTLAERYCDGFLFSRAAPAVVLGPKPLDQMETNSWIEMGWSRVKLPGIGNLLCADGRTKLLDDAVVLMRSLKGWGISIAYAQILVRLRASETSNTIHG
ncbi:zinc finger rst2 [Fusarium tjaetaba]|uniref:Zinc finger rst2 n=1 Tax=Fusarium tjaetaba TaxID=1567544 RepID=A0A8H5S0L4_9HYPO|nr:zinc finger rst2 [Fusarium tjaetaba]KAF5642458.1 zinc finger rst2 [Fusarium tjaetaba]